MNSRHSNHKIKRVFVLTSNQVGVADLCNILLEYEDVQIYAAEEAYKFLKAERVEVNSLCKFTGLPCPLDATMEILQLDILEALFLNKEKHKHQKHINDKKRKLVDLLIVNFKDQFEIEAGKISAIAVAAANSSRVAVVMDKDDYERILTDMAENNGAGTESSRKFLAIKALKTAAEHIKYVASSLAG
jgi:phosphoribosylaminoimidazolecarboxamide formyltransferase / IMP cyclohydrolase